MCYPKPGPICSAHARNKYVKAKATARREGSFDANIALREAAAEFLTTPAGFRELKRKISIGEQVESNTELLLHYKKLRASQLAAVNVKDERC